ncbi:MAG TPA: class I SAM-dependent methyltransferase [Thermodesulfobacteriota bacterium]|nr:class I SAM-dependent methyltransferase [Thermodesulfobacteriota bacterium]
MTSALNITPINHDLCPVCEIELDARSLVTMVLSTPRGNQAWARCPGCQSFFAAEPYDLEQEVQHTRTRPWGKVESNDALNEYKGLMFEAILRVLRTYAPPGDTLLDVGCSYGGFLQRAQREGYRVRGIDIVPEAVEYVRTQGIACNCVKSVGELDIPEGSQGIISVLDCNYYWPSQRKELRALQSRLRPKGLLVMRVVDTSWAVRIGLWLRRCFPTVGQRLCERAVYDHRVSIPVQSLLRIVRQEGFKIIYTSLRDAMPSHYNSLKVKTAYTMGHFVWRIAGCYVAPGCVFLARKRAP